MSGGPVGGYLLFPPASTRADLIRVTLQAMELAPEEFEVGLYGEEGYSEEGYPFRTEEPLERALEFLAQEEGGMINGRGSKGAETYWFEPPVASYQPITIWVRDSAMLYPERADCIESFARRWPHLCEQGQAVFGYFCPFEHMFYRDYLKDKILPAFQSNDVRHFLEQIMPSWLIYLGPALAERWRQEQMPVPSPLLVSQDLPSGAHFLRASKGVEEASLSVFRPW